MGPAATLCATAVPAVGGGQITARSPSSHGRHSRGTTIRPSSNLPGPSTLRRELSHFLLAVLLLLLLLGGDLEGDLEAEVLLGNAVERLEVADPQRVQRRVGGELRRRPLAQARAGVGGDDERLVQD